MRREQPDFSIVIPTYGRPAQLTACLESLTLLQFPRDRFEVVVVDDGGQEPLLWVISRFRSQLNLQLIRQENAGPATARNTGAARAEGRYLAFTDDDCTPAPDWLRRLSLRFARAPRHGIGGRTINAIPDNPWSSASQQLIDYLYSYYNTECGGSLFLATNNLALPADSFQAIGGFDVAFSRAGGEDRELCARWLQSGYRLTYAPEAIVYHAHSLTLPTFLRQHFNYGRGACQYRRVRARQGQGGVKLESPRFYMNLLFYPLSQARRQTALTITGLLLSQLANAAGFTWECMRETVEEQR